ncbi:hypothetical protein IWQ61_002445 [Dispira simplex]|nr:hypothetical protein IWQ61_002445 [Dispira simplex]
MRIFTLALATLMAYCTVAPVEARSVSSSSPTEPSLVRLTRRQQPNGEQKWFLYQIVQKYPEVIHISENITLFAFCSITGKKSCMEYRANAYSQFWTLLRNGKISDNEKKGVDMVIAQGDTAYVRLLFADGTIFCKRSDGMYLGPLSAFTFSKVRKNSDSNWAKALAKSQAYFPTILQKYFDRFKYEQKIPDLSKVESSLAAKGCTSYYDISIRDGLDSMIKWTVAGGFRESVQPILDAFPPQGQFYNFMLGSLYDTILVNNSDITTTLRAWVDCTKVFDDYQGFCYNIQADLIKGGGTGDFPRNSNVLSKQLMATVARDDVSNVKKDISNFNRREINLLWLLDNRGN